ncbi:carbohydrate-binding module family 1 protein [Dothidotthia symphoricarpi CBS 119687]|uniref:Carbohydrate-binding module family 1 protein n=1 Tax=Dothidotthia symphoricarpi CBS 119687 TaxID=1392245 RepID=A0A6A5ZWY5_9PLEO|nr:carbohydrate-binding module family 1 protein [Dothidotthia symphoricarpi CBS 119687]KAF2123535.1 carbohydrate-binding module family 1 protein [Dothidotthia symphoricarpi CBS 119687]
MARTFAVLSALFALRAAAQTSSVYTDEKTNITFNGLRHTSGYTLGFALPENPTTDFIAQIQAPITNGAGWAGFSMGQSMAGNLLVVAWPNEGEIVSSFREATGYTNPAVTTGDFKMTPIPEGTYVNDTAFSYTFLCSNCISDDVTKGLVIYEAPSNNIVGWAYSADALTDSTSASATLNYHSGGFGAFGCPMANATSADYETWAALAVAGSDSGSGNSTTPVGGSNSTTPVTTPISANSTATVANETYDYIVAGAGAAGIVVAERLAESGASVLLIERGGPSYASTGNTDTLSWNDTMTMYDVPGYGYYLSTVGSPAYCTDTADMAGCLVGGGTAVNALMFVKPQAKDFDDKWPESWKSTDMSAAADRVWERNPGQTYGSEDGERYNDQAYDVLSQFFKGQGWAETDFIKDPNSKVNVFGHSPWNVADGLRSGVVRTYLPLAQDLSNFKLMTNTNVVRTVREGSSATGVEIETADGKRMIYNVKTGGNVILAAGAMSTPRILFNSGIGPSEQLKIVASGSSGVTLPDEADWIDLPVGAEIKDHPIFTIKFTTSTPMFADATTAWTSPNQTTVDLFAKNSGILAQSGQRLNWWSSVNTTAGNEVFFQGTCNGPSNNTIQMKVYMTHGASSVGSLGITADGATTFITNPLMNSDDDTEAITLMLERLLKMTSGSNSTLTIVAGTGVTNVTAADLIKEYKSGSHYVGTAKMGTKGEAGVVVDTDTKVYGTDNLFVVDASMHPDLPTGNTQAIIMVAAEAAAARILALGSSSGTTPSVPAASSVAPIVSSAASEPSSVVPEATGVSSATSAAAISSVAASSAAPVASSSSVVSLAASSASPSRTASPVVPSASHVATASSKPVASRPTPTSAKSSAAAKPTSSAAAAAATAYAQCGGKTWTGATTCVEGWSCTKQNDYYSQCTRSSSRRSAPVKRRASRHAAVKEVSY